MVDIVNIPAKHQHVSIVIVEQPKRYLHVTVVAKLRHLAASFSYCIVNSISLSC